MLVRVSCSEVRWSGFNFSEFRNVFSRILNECLLGNLECNFGTSSHLRERGSWAEVSIIEHTSWLIRWELLFRLEECSVGASTPTRGALGTQKLGGFLIQEW